MDKTSKKTMTVSKVIKKKERKLAKRMSEHVKKILSTSPDVPPVEICAENLSSLKEKCSIPKSAPAQAPAQEENCSFEAEHDVCHSTGDKMRDKVRALLYKELRMNASVEYILNCDTVAAAIEEAMSKKFENTNRPYRDKFRDIRFNLQDAKNQKVRDAVLKKKVAPSRVVQITTEELANEELKKKRQMAPEKIGLGPKSKDEASEKREMLND